MRPQRNAGENGWHDVSHVWFEEARFNEAPAKCRGKLGVFLYSRQLGGCGFNEAPAKCRGKRWSELPQAGRLSRASMRPQRNAGENSQERWCNSPDGDRFNEAPAKCRGKLTITLASYNPQLGFNEAPAKCRGKPPNAPS